MPRTSRSVSAIALVVALLLLLVAVPSTALAAGAVVFRDHQSTTGQDLGPNICGWPSALSGGMEAQLLVVDAGNGNFHVTYHQTDNWTLVIANDPSVPESVRGETWRGRNEINYILNVDPSAQRVIEIFLNPNGEGPFRGLLEKTTLVISPDGTVRVDNHEFVGEVDCAAFD